MSRRVVIEVNGIQYANFVGMSLTAGLRQMSRSFAIDAIAAKGELLPFGVEDLCTIFLDGKRILTGKIEEVTSNISASDHTVSIVGRDKCAALVDSDVNVMSELKPPVSLKSALEAVIEHLGADISVIDTVGDAFRSDVESIFGGTGYSDVVSQELQPFTKGDDLIAAEPGDSCKSYCEKFAKKRRVLLTSNEFGNLVITDGRGVVVESEIRHSENDDKNNVISATLKRSSKSRFRSYVDLSQGSVLPLTEAGSVTGGKLVDSTGRATDRAIREGRQQVISSDTSGNEKDSKNRAEWTSAIRKAQSESYQCMLDDFNNQNGGLWQPGMIPFVVDEFGRLNKRMLVDKVKYILDESGGHCVNVRLVDRSSYIQELGNA